MSVQALSTALANAGATTPLLVPPVPQQFSDLGLPQTLVEQMALRALYGRGEQTGRELAIAMGVPYSLLDPIVEHFKRSRLLEAKRSMGMGNVSTVFTLTDTGRALARQAMEMTQYVGPAPVPLAQYTQAVMAQKLQGGWLKKEVLQKAYRHMVMHPRVLSQVGPAVNSFSSFLIYGSPGNGKTYLAEALAQLECPDIFMPYAIEANGAIIQVFDPIYHRPVQDNDGNSFAVDMRYDGRWFRTRRPFIMTGGELTLDMLDLSYNEVGNFYDAPFQVKSNNGIYLIDDFGRQRVTPAEVLNRWIVPMERKVDYLTLRTGGKVAVPFEALLVFSTNLKPDQLGDEAFLRRIRYKMLMKSPDIKEFATIWMSTCQQKGLPCAPEVLERFLQKRYLATGKKMRRCHPRDIIGHAVDLIQFEKLPAVLNDELLDMAFESCFVGSEDMD